MKPLLITASILGMVCAALATLVAVVFCLGMGANAKPPEIRALKIWMLSLTLLGLGGIVGGILLLRAGKLGWATGISFAPAVIMGVIFLIAMLK